MSATTDNLRRLRWRARRGLAELDLLLASFLAEEPALSREEIDAFERLLSAPDGVLRQWLLGQATPVDGAVAALIRRIRAHAAH